jgi:hypothetical protein
MKGNYSRDPALLPSTCRVPYIGSRVSIERIRSTPPPGPPRQAPLPLPALRPPTPTSALLKVTGWSMDD